MRLWLRNIRLMRRMTEKQVADAAGIAQPFYHRIENGAAPSVQTAKKISKILGFDWTLFFPDEETA